VKEIDYEGKLVSKMNDVYTNDGKEDPRLFVMNNNLYLSYNQVILKNQDIPKIDSVKVRYDMLMYDGNSFTSDMTGLQIPFKYNVNSCQEWEKNWIFFENDGTECFVYSFVPFIVVNIHGELIRNQNWMHPMIERKQRERSCVPRYRPDTKWYNMENNSEISFHIRGGCPPVRLEDDLYFFVHTRCMPETLYNMMVIVVDKNLRLKGYSDIFDVKTETPHKILFPMGAVYDMSSSTWYISCGLDDQEQVIIRIQHEFLLGKINYITQ
jgi:predicted GH43/DUF377 family glycosyl hydrolase